RLELPASGSRSFDLEAGTKRRFQRCLTLNDRHAIFRFKVDSIKSAATPEYLLGGVNIHHDKVAAECLGHPRRAHDASYGEGPFPSDRKEGNLAVDLQFVPRREFFRDQKRVGLGQEHERVIDNGFVRILQFVISKTAVTCHIDSKDKHGALT